MAARSAAGSAAAAALASRLGGSAGVTRTCRKFHFFLGCGGGAGMAADGCCAASSARLPAWRSCLQVGRCTGRPGDCSCGRAGNSIIPHPHNSAVLTLARQPTAASELHSKPLLPQRAAIPGPASTPITSNARQLALAPCFVLCHLILLVVCVHIRIPVLGYLLQRVAEQTGGSARACGARISAAKRMAVGGRTSVCQHRRGTAQAPGTIGRHLRLVSSCMEGHRAGLSRPGAAASSPKLAQRRYLASRHLLRCLCRRRQASNPPKSQDPTCCATSKACAATTSSCVCRLRSSSASASCRVVCSACASAASRSASVCTEHAGHTGSSTGGTGTRRQRCKRRRWENAVGACLPSTCRHPQTWGGAPAHATKALLHGCSTGPAVQYLTARERSLPGIAHSCATISHHPGTTAGHLPPYPFSAQTLA